MAATVEVQTTTAKFVESLLSTIRHEPRCLPTPLDGLQVQRVRYRGAAIRHHETGKFRIWEEPDPRVGGDGGTWITAKQAQLAVDATLDVAQTSTIAANPNTLASPDMSVDVTLVLNLDCERAKTPGWVEIKTRLVNIEPTSVPNWARQQLAQLFAIPPLQYDFSSAIPPGASFLNAGLAVDTSGTRLAIKAELPLRAQNNLRWKSFRDGDVPDRLGGHDWSLFSLSADFANALKIRVENNLKDQLKNTVLKLITVNVQYRPQPQRAVFIIEPRIDIRGLDDLALDISGLEILSPSLELALFH